MLLSISVKIELDSREIGKEMKSWICHNKTSQSPNKACTRAEDLHERIICFKRDILSKYPLTKKVFYEEELWKDIINNLRILPRSEAEKEYRYKQLVVYALVKAGDTYVMYRRTKRSAEEKLRHKFSLGIGGHVNVADRNQHELLAHLKSHNHESSMDFIIRGVWREINEEVDIQSTKVKNPDLICFINDDSNAVGLLHFGLVWLLEIEKPRAIRKGKGIGKIEFRDLRFLKRNQSGFESWSRLLIDFLVRESGVNDI